MEQPTVNEPIDGSDLKDAMKELQREHPTLQQRLAQYRDRRSSYDAKRLGRPTTSSTPARQSVARDFRG
jgi:hypothetical protein